MSAEINAIVFDTFRARWLAVAVVDQSGTLFLCIFIFAISTDPKYTIDTSKKHRYTSYIYRNLTKKETFSDAKTHFGATENFYNAILLHIL